jgi:hypothetical protein
MTPTRVAPVDRLLAAFNLIMALFWATVLDASAAAPWICAAHAAAIALPWLFAHPEQLSHPVRVLRRAYPLLWLLAFWTEVDPLRRALHVYANDTVIRALDIAAFGVALHAEWMPAMPSLWVSEPLHFAYFAYYAAIALPLLALALQRRRADLHEAELRLLLTYTACFVAYALFPVDGPHRFEPMYAGRPADGLWYRVVHSINDAGGALGAAFPSSHAAGAVTIAYLGWRFFSRPVARLMTVHAVMVVLATFYTQYHYAIDAAAGTAWALALQIWIAPALLRVPQPRLRAPRLPALPSGWNASQTGARL